jgi:predicted enzyme related to lactoylglutathione lyase
MANRPSTRGMGFARPRSTDAEGQPSAKGLVFQTAFVAIAAPSFDAVIAFYQRLLDQAPAAFAPGRYGEFCLGDLRVGIFHPQASHQGEFAAASSGPLSLCLEVPQLEAAIAQVRAAGGACLDDITLASHGREVYAYDPAGNRLILHEGRNA